MQWLRTFCLSFALLLVLGHQLVPHIHGHEITHADGYHAATNHDDSPWWMQLFSLDQGAEHLEHFRQNRESATETADLLIAPAPLMPATLPWLLTPVVRQCVMPEAPVLPVVHGFAVEHGLRGPPMA